MTSKKKKQDLITCIVIYIFLIAAYIPTRSMRNGAEFMPWLIIGIAALCNTILLVRVLRTVPEDQKGEGYIDFSVSKVPILAFAGMIIYAILVKYTNYFIATAIMLPTFMLIEKIKKIWLIVLIDVIYLAFIYVMFVIVLKVPMI